MPPPRPDRAASAFFPTPDAHPAVPTPAEPARPGPAYDPAGPASDGQSGGSRGRRHARRRSRAPVVMLALLVGACLTVASFLARSGGEGATDAGAGVPGETSEPVALRDRSVASLVLSNAGFEAGTEGWRPVSARLTRVAPGRESAAAVRIAPGATTESEEEGPGMRAFAVVPAAPRDTVVTGTVWVKASKPGMTVLLKLIEREGDRTVGATSATRRLADGAWQSVTVSHRARSLGAAIDLLVAAPKATDPLLADGVVVRLDDAPAPAAPEPADPDEPLIANG